VSRILVAGGAGFIGSALVPRLLERGHDVVVVDLLWFGNHLPPEVEVRQRNVLDLTEEDLRGFDQVIFLAGLSNDPMAEYSPAQNFVFNAACPGYLAYIAKKAGAGRYVYASSCSVYGYTGNQLYTEVDVPTSTYPYGISKLQGEFGVLQLQDPSFSVIALRKGTVCGYSPRMRLDLVINTMFASAVSKHQINVTNPTIWRPILGIEDAVDAYILAVESGHDVSGVFNIASENCTLADLGERVRDAIQDELSISATLLIASLSDVRNYRVAIDKARSILRYEPKTTVRSIVRDLSNHLGEFRDFDDASYHNIRRFAQLAGSFDAPATPTLAAAPLV
jgi:nucleoside-diphosphate-sugar epimerase